MRRIAALAAAVSGRATVLRCIVTLLCACGPSKERDAALADLSERSPKQRADAVARLGRAASASDQRAWLALFRSARDGAASVRVAAAEAGPALVAVVKREHRMLLVDRASVRPRRTAEDEDGGSAAELAGAAAPAPAADRNKYAQLMARLEARQGAQAARGAAQEKLSGLLLGEAGPRRALLAEALRSALALRAPGAEAEARALAADPDPEIAAAARGEESTPTSTPNTTSTSDPPTLRLQLFSDDGALRAAACLALREDAASAAVRQALAADAERRVRLACGGGETAAPIQR